MNAEKLMQYLPDPNVVKEKIGVAVETLQEQAPLLVQEILRWHFTISLILFVLGFLILLSAGLYMKRIWKWAIETDNEAARCLLIPTIIYPAVSFLIMGFNLEWLQILVAPRLFLIEYISKLF